MTFVDTNYFLRFLLADIDRQHQEAKKLFLDGAAGRIKLASSTIVFFEIYWVLSSYYHKKKEEIVPALQDILRLAFIFFPERKILRDTVDLFERNNLNLEDCYNLCFAKNWQVKDFRTFDAALAKKAKNII